RRAAPRRRVARDPAPPLRRGVLDRAAARGPAHPAAAAAARRAGGDAVARADDGRAAGDGQPRHRRGPRPHRPGLAHGGSLVAAPGRAPPVHLTGNPPPVPRVGRGVVPDLPAGANVALPGAALGIALDGPFDLSALVLSASGAVAGDADMVFFNQPDAPGVRLRGAQLTVRPEALRRGAERVVVVASPEDLNKAVRTLPPVLLTDARERPFARFRPPPMPTQTVALL